MQVHARYIDLSAPDPKIRPIELSIWEPDPDEPRYLRFVRMRTVGEVYDELKKRLKEEELLPDEYFDIYGVEWKGHKYGEERNVEFPKDYWRVFTFAVTGSSEGHYIHVALLVNGQFANVFLGKTLLEGDKGMDFALRVAGACTKHLGC